MLTGTARTTSSWLEPTPFSSPLARRLVRSVPVAVAVTQNFPPPQLAGACGLATAPPSPRCIWYIACERPAWQT